MSRIKEKAREIAREGEEKRGAFTPQGTPLRIYVWWLQHTKRKVSKVGLCSYFWIVVLWAPLLFMCLMLEKVFRDRQFWLCQSLAVAAIVIGVSIAYPGGIGMVVFGVVAFFVAAFGLIAGYALVDYLKDKSTFDDVPKWLKFAAVAVLVVAFPTAIAGFTIGLVVTGLASKPAKRFYRWMGESRLIDGRISPFGLMLLFVAASLVAMSVVGGWWVVPLSVTGLLAAIVAIRWAVEKLGNYLAQRRAGRRKNDQYAARQRSLNALQPVLRTIFVQLHPAHQEDEGAYWNWYQGYVDRVERWNSETVWSNIYHYASPYYFPDWSEWGEGLLAVVTDELEQLQRQLLLTESQTQQLRQDVIQKVTSPFAVMADFIILSAEFIYALKKKICPVVELPEDL